ncbi:hypothetical protein ACVXG7_29530 [Enterobacter hormaechei]
MNPSSAYCDSSWQRRSDRWMRSATAVAALRQRYGLPVLTPQAIDAAT